MTFDRLLGFLSALDCDTYITIAEHDTGVPEKPGRVVVRGQEGSMEYATHDGSTMSLQIKEGRAHWTERISPDSQAESYDFDPSRVREISKMFGDRAQGFLDNSLTTAVFSGDAQRLSAGDCAYIAAILNKSVEEDMDL